MTTAPCCLPPPRAATLRSAADGRAGIGDPTEVAILIAAAERGIHRDEIERTNPRVTVTPFDAVSKRMSIERADGRVYIKGAVESVLPLCVDGPTTSRKPTTQMAERGLRILAVAVAPAGRSATERPASA